MIIETVLYSVPMNDMRVWHSAGQRGPRYIIFHYSVSYDFS